MFGVVLVRRSLLGGTMRRHLLSLLAFVACFTTAPAQSFSSKDTIAYTTATIRMREQPAPTAKTVAILAEGTRVRLYHCSEGWCGVSVQRTAGYALEEFLTTQQVGQTVAAPRSEEHTSELQ